MSAQDYDYVIVGGGTAGCTLAARLTEDPGTTVLLVEAGPRRSGMLDRWKIDMPAAFEHAYLNLKYNWMYNGEPEPHLQDRRILQPRGKILGGSSAINGMVYLRGHAQDFERWEREGASGWSWPEVLPYFKRAETWQGGETKYRGGSGPVSVQTGTDATPLYAAFLNAGQEAGHPASDDINGAQQEGFARSQMNVHNGIRASMEQAYIRPNAGRANLTIVDRATTLNLRLSGNRAIGVTYAHSGGTQIANVRNEVILAAGAIGSPQVLMLSGIGPAAHLAEMGIACRIDLPGVGQNLQNHPLVYQKFAIDKPVSLNAYMRPDRMVSVGARWMLTGGGLGSTNTFEALALLRSDSSVAHPDVLTHFIPVLMTETGQIRANMHGFALASGAARMEASGWVKLRSADPRENPRIFSNFMATEGDRAIMRRSVEMMRDLVSRPSFAKLGAKEIDPGDEVKTPAEIDAYLRKTVAGDYHLSCTCKMGTDQMSVVGPDLRVHGIEGLRIVDASVMPSIVSANTNATTNMIAEKGADMIRGRDPLPRINLAATH